MREAARLVRAEEYPHIPKSSVGRAQLFNTMARIVWRNNWKLADRLLLEQPLVAHHILVIENKVVLRDPAAFQREFSEARCALARASAAKADSPGFPALSKRARARAHAAEKANGLWSPLSSKLFFSARTVLWIDVSIINSLSSLCRC